MIFNNNTSSTGAVKESKYELGLSGALMHVYENECNFNAIVKSVGLSELKYYQETGKDLFLNEAGAFSSFIAKVKEFFKKVLEKIKAIFHKFMAVINSFVMKDKEFVKKYGNEIRRKDITDLEFNGYKKLAETSGIDVMYVKEFDSLTKRFSATKENNKDLGDIEKQKNENRGALIAKTGEYTRTEMLEEVRELVYGNKETFTVTDTIRANAVSDIENTSKATKSYKEAYDKLDKSLKQLIKDLEAAEKNYVDLGDFKEEDAGANDDPKEFVKNKNANRTKVIQNFNVRINILKELADDATALHGFFAGAIKDANRQARAICVKIIGYKKQESARLESANDIFAGVQLV